MRNFIAQKHKRVRDLCTIKIKLLILYTLFIQIRLNVGKQINISHLETFLLMGIYGVP